MAVCDYCVATSTEWTYDEMVSINRRKGIMKHHRSLLASSICLAATLLIVPGAAQSQSLTPNVTYNNPPTMPKPPGYTQVVEANTPGRILFIAGQLGYDAAGKQGPDFRTQTTLVFEKFEGGR